MTPPYTINTNRPLTDSQDYAKLSALGLSYIQTFSKDIWTDYNAHDPGITMMEVLSYVITDLGNRTALPIQDLLARADGDTSMDFFTAREILPCNTVTFDDLRKKIIDVDGVENAWIIDYSDSDDVACADEISNAAYYIRCKKTDPAAIYLNPEPDKENEPRVIHGLYRFDLLLEEDPVLGDLNILSVDYEMKTATGIRQALVRFTFPLVTQKVYPARSGVVTSFDKIASVLIDTFTITNFSNQSNTFDLDMVCGGVHVVIPQVSFNIQPVIDYTSLADLKNTLQSYITLPANEGDVKAKILSVFSAKVARVSSIIDNVYCNYQRIRNLCEDVIKIDIVQSQEIAICADIEIVNGADLEEILGEIYFLVQSFFSPPVKFYQLNELVAKGISTDIIFEGPLLKHGFILDDDLRVADLFSELHVSDLYNVIMGIDGVTSISYLQVTNYINGIPQTDGERWKLTLNADVHLTLDRLRSKIVFYKGDVPIIADTQVANRIYADYMATISKPRINPSLQSLNDILPPVGTYYSLEEYYSAQNEFPAIYGVGKDGNPSGIDFGQKAKIKQLKGYFLFFDQILANYLSQLSGVKNLLSVNNADNTTYFSQPVYDTPVPKAEDANFYYNPPVPVANVQMPDSENLNFYGVAPLLKDFEMPDTADMDDPDTYASEWAGFVNNKTNPYRQYLDSIVEPADDTLDRRNRFLDHLLARFAENFADYAAMMYQFSSVNFYSSDKLTAEEIAESKFKFLQQYDTLSYNRGKGQYYKYCAGESSTPPVAPARPVADDILEYETYNIPKPENSSGLQKRAAFLLGMGSNDNTFLIKDKFIVYPSGTKFKFEIDYDAPHKLNSVLLYPDEVTAFGVMDELISLAVAEDQAGTSAIYFLVNSFGGGYRIEVRESPTATTNIAVSDVYTNQDDALDGIKKLKSAFYYEGMHIIEHLLLRPLPVKQTITTTDLNEGFFPLCACLNPDCDCPSTDYYSFRISTVLPYWTQRFRNLDFREFVEDTIHKETPAHILPKFCWVSLYDMNRFENAYYDWFVENMKYKPHMNALKVKLLELIKVLNTLSNVYPDAHLHDCADPSTGNPVILNRTNLGTF